MAFVFKAEPKEPVDDYSTLPGPGQYLGRDNYTFNENKIGFHSTTKRDQMKTVQDPDLGPGSYDVTGNMLAPDKTQNVFFMPAEPGKEIEHSRATNVFKSKTKRFENNGDTENPGPASYFKDLNSAKKKKNYPQPSIKSKKAQAQAQQNIHNIPSIPSNVHSYGYTENDEHELVLNPDPLAQALDYVGPGYYEATSNQQGVKYKGPAWHKSGIKKLESFAKNTATSQLVGPGTYEAPENTLPPFKTKPNAGFVSTTTRSFDAYVKHKLNGGAGKLYNRTPLSSNSEVGGRRLSAAETDIDSDDEYMKEATPGPGYYHNESMLSSFGVRSPSSDYSITGDRMKGFARTKPHGFGRSQRFKEQQTTTKELGPGDYNIKVGAMKLEKKAKIPFQSSNTRFERVYPPLQPGPGTYNPPLTLVDRVQDKAKSGYVGSFGITEKRFKISKLIEDTPGPGTYTQGNQKDYVEDITAAFRKGSHYFTSSSQRMPFQVKNGEINAAPGSYSLSHFDIATKVIKEEEDGDMPKRYPFNSGQARFEKPKEKVIPEDEDEDDDDEPRFGAARNFDSLLKPKTKGKANAVFQSSTKRTAPGFRTANPGPGSYYDANHNMWNKRTFNIHFTGD